MTRSEEREKLIEALAQEIYYAVPSEYDSIYDSVVRRSISFAKNNNYSPNFMVKKVFKRYDTIKRNRA